jgi:hypothetical protein
VALAILSLTGPAAWHTSAEAAPLADVFIGLNPDGSELVRLIAPEGSESRVGKSFECGRPICSEFMGGALGLVDPGTDPALRIVSTLIVLIQPDGEAFAEAVFRFPDSESGIPLIAPPGVPLIVGDGTLQDVSGFFLTTAGLAEGFKFFVQTDVELGRIPEPAPLLLFAAGTAGLLAARRRRVRG